MNDFASERGIDLRSAEAANCVAVVTDWYRSRRADDVAREGDSDMLLFQWGTYDWGEGAYFEYDLTRQLVAGDEDDDDSAIWQMSCTLQYPTGAETDRLGRGDEWCTSPAELDAFLSMIETAPATAFARSARPVRIDLRLEPAG